MYRVQTGVAHEVQRVVINAAPGSGSGPKFKSVPVTNPLGAEVSAFGQVVTTAQLRAFVGQVPSKNAIVLNVGENSTDALGAQSEVMLPNAPWAAATAWGNQVAALVPTAGGGSFTVARLENGTTTTTTIGDVGPTSIQGAALVALHDSLVAVLGTPGAITLQRFPGAGSTVSKSAASVEKMTVDTTLLQGFDGVHVAAAAARTRIAVVWTRSSQLQSGQPVGGWAILQCAPG